MNILKQILSYAIAFALIVMVATKMVDINGDSWVLGFFILLAMAIAVVLIDKLRERW